MRLQDSDEHNAHGDVEEEDAPLIGPDVEAERPPSITDPKIHYLRFMALIYTLLFLIVFGGMMLFAPQTRIYESIVCRNYYDAHEPDKYRDGYWIPEAACKKRAIQGEVAVLGGVGASLVAIPGLLLAYFYAQLADNPRIGRRMVLFMSMAGLVMSGVWGILVCWFYKQIPIRWSWFGSVFMLFGGGVPTMISTMTTMMADVVPPGKRATAFFQIGLASVAAQLTGRPLSSALMKKNPWIPFTLGFTIFTASMGLVLLFPETAHLAAKASLEQVPSIPLDVGEAASSDDGTPLTIFKRVRKLRRSVWEGTHFLRQHRSIPPIIVTFLVFSFILKQNDLLLLYASAKYGIEIADVGFLTMIGPLVDILLILIVMPQASNYLTKKLNYSDAKKDLRLAQLSLLPLISGTLLMATAPNVPLLSIGMAIFTLGTGFIALNRSLVTSLVEPLHVARLYAIITMISSLGEVLGAPLLAGLYEYGLSLGPRWMGLPFFFVAGLCAAAALIMICVRLPEAELPDLEDRLAHPPPYRDEEPFTDEE